MKDIILGALAITVVVLFLIGTYPWQNGIIEGGFAAAILIWGVSSIGRYNTKRRHRAKQQGRDID